MHEHMRAKIFVSYVNTYQKSFTLAEELNKQVEKTTWPIDLGNFVICHPRSSMMGI